MMRKIVVTTLTALSLVLSVSVMAAETKTPEKEKTPAVHPIAKNTEQKSEHKIENTADKKTVKSTIDLYESPELKAKIIKKLPIFSDLVAIYRKGDWLKVGDREDGSTGWINLHQYNTARENYYHSAFQMQSESVYLKAEKNEKGKTDIVAYRNGKKLTPEEAKALYDHMQVQERRQWDAMQHFNEVMDMQMSRNYLDARRAMDSAFQASMMSMPEIVVIQNPPAKK